MLKPQDIVTLLKVFCSDERDWTYTRLAESLRMSSSQVHAALIRCEESGLYDRTNRQVRKHALHEFLVHGLKYAFPGKLGAVARGIPTAHSAEPLKNTIVSHPDSTYIWATPTGCVRGQTIEPLHRCVPEVALVDREFYEFLSLVEAIRVGRVREQHLAAQELAKRLSLTKKVGASPVLLGRL